MTAVTGARPTLLFISPRFLFPIDEGGKIRTANILRHLKDGAFHITLASPAPPDVNAFAGDVGAVCDDFRPWPATPASRLRRIAALIDRRPVSVATDDTPQGRDAIAGALRAKPDVILVDFPHAAVLAPHRFASPAICFTHNVEAEIYERHARRATGLMRPVWHSQARKMQRYEGDTLRRFDRVIAVSRRDAKALERRFGLAHVDPIDTGVDLDFFGASPIPATTGTVVFTGVMDSPANIEGVRFLAEHVWPLLERTHPGTRALIIGRNPPGSLQAAAPKSFSFTGTVDDIRPHFARGDVAVIPLHVGSGTRIKTFEAMAMNRPVVSTTIGVEGLDVVDGEHLLIADEPQTFAAAIARLLDNPAQRQSLAQNARNLVETRFSWAHVAHQFEAICLDAHRARTQP